MKYKITYLHCGEHLKESLKTEIQEVVQVVESIDWQDEFKVIQPRSTLFHQTAYNKRFELEFQQLGWETKPKLSLNPRLIEDFRKNWCLLRFSSETAQRYIGTSINSNTDFRTAFCL